MTSAPVVGNGVVQNSSSSEPVRVRFAPSPTGFLHVGGARSLFFNWLYAQKHGGTLILRIEDTDQARSTPEHEKMILEDIRALNLPYQEGPDVAGGQYGPYRQSERMDIYAQKAKELLDRDQAYFCFCSDDLLTQKREVAMKLGKPPHYDGTCARLSKEEVQAKFAKGEKAGLRFRAFKKDYILKDHVRGDVSFREGMVGDFFITRTPTEVESKRGVNGNIGMPVYNFCCVIDDHLMQMTHIIRGEDHLSNTARQLMIYDAFGWKLPEFAHIAMVLGADKQKLSKRNGDSSVHEYLENGYLPEALLNFLALLGWWPSGELKPASGHPEIISRQELIQYFDLNGLQKSPAVFDVQKLKWMNGQYIKAMAPAELAKRARPFFEAAGSSLLKNASFSDAWFEGVLETVKNEVALLSELPAVAEFYFGSSPALDAEAKTQLADAAARPVVECLVKALGSGGESITATEVETLQKSVQTESGVKGKALFMSMRAVITGKTHGPELKKILPLLGRDFAMKRIEQLRSQAGL